MARTRARAPAPRGSPAATKIEGESYPCSAPKPSPRQRHSVSVLRRKQMQDGQQDDAQVKTKTPIVQVIKIVLDPLGDAGIAAPAIHLSPACNSHLQVMAGVVKGNS